MQTDSWLASLGAWTGKKYLVRCSGGCSTDKGWVCALEGDGTRFQCCMGAKPYKWGQIVDMEGKDEREFAGPLDEAKDFQFHLTGWFMVELAEKNT